MKPKVYDFINSRKIRSKNEIATSEKYHFKNRYRERLGVRCTDPIYKELLNELRSGKMVFKKYSDKNKRVYSYNINGDLYDLVYNPDTGEFVTIFA
jgi:hypothetical protein